MGFLSRFFQNTSKQHETLPLYFYNSLTQQKELFTPLKPGKVSMYTCGNTVYDHAHVGNLRAAILPDLVKRTCIYNGYDVENVINFTDFGHLTDDGDNGEDKMMRALKREGKPATLAAMRDVAEQYMQSFKDDNLALHNLPPTYYTPASEYVKDQIRLIKTLYEKGYAYETSDGVYYDISRFKDYGRLGNINSADLKSGARVEVNTEKKNPADFALWKKGLLGWESPWGKGFPGWHIECTAMCFAKLGKQIDIHTGGEDLMYTHHNAEIAQAEAVTGKQYVRYWLHNAHIKVNDAKIAKSLGNGIRLAQLKDQGFSPLVYRYWLLTSHYRTQANFTFDALKASKQALFKLKRFMVEHAKEKGSVNESYQKKFHLAINDDLDTPKAIAILWELYKDDSVSDADKVATMKNIDEVLQIGLSDTTSELVRALGVVKEDEVPEEVQTLLDERQLARSTQNWDESDRLREAINLKGYLVEDTPQGQKITKQ